MIIFLLFASISAKYISTVLSLTPEDPWKYVSKFASNIGTGSWEMKAQFVKAIDTSRQDTSEFQGIIYIDKKWEDALSQKSCKAKEEISKRSLSLSLPLNGEWSNPIRGSMTQNTRTHFWYFAISQCELTERQKIRIEMKMINSDDSEFSAEEHGMQYAYPVILLVYLLALSGNILRLVKKFQQTEDLEMNLLVLNVAIGCQYTGILCEVIHIWVYAYNGYGIVVFDVFYQVLEVLSSIIVTILLIIIASGWTLKFKDFPDADIYIPISLFVVILNLMVVGVGRITEDSYNKFSDYEGVPGYFLVTFRVLLWAWFVYLIKDMQKTANAKLMSFLVRFLIMASLYFLALPAVIIFSWVFEPYVRNKVVVVLTNLIQILVFLFLTHLFSEKSLFYKVSTLSQSVLPGKSQ